MQDGGLINFIWSNRFNRTILILLAITIILALMIKYLIWSELLLAPFIFFGIGIPLQLIWINFIPYRNYSEWIKLFNDFNKDLTFRKDVKVYIKNFYPWVSFIVTKSYSDSFYVPFYDFEKADILSSSDMIIILGKSNLMFNFKINRPFVIRLNSNTSIKKEIYQVEFLKKYESDNFFEITFRDHSYKQTDPITIKIYK